MNTAKRFWEMVQVDVQGSRYEAFLLIRQGSSGTYKGTGLLGSVRRWTSNDGSLILDVRADYRHVSCVKG